MFKSKIIFAIILLLAAGSATAQKKGVLSPAKISKLLPAKIKGYSLKGAPVNKRVKVGTLTYSLSEKTFIRKQSTIKILLFDYGQAPIMYEQAIKGWSEIKNVENDSIIFRPLASFDSVAWESYAASSKHSQIIMGINQRFFLTINGEKTEIYELKEILKNFAFDKFPKNQ